VGRGKFKKPLHRELFVSHAASARFFACPQPQPHLRAGGVSTPQTGRSGGVLERGHSGVILRAVRVVSILLLLAACRRTGGTGEGRDVAHHIRRNRHGDTSETKSLKRIFTQFRVGSSTPGDESNKRQRQAVNLCKS